MTGHLQAEIRQTRPFELREETLLNVLRTADALLRRGTEVLKPFGLTHAQYNVLRILRGAGEGGHTCREIGERMLTFEPDVTRMLDRLEKRGLVTRSRDAEDRRVVRTRITRAGLHTLERADPVVQAMQLEVAAHVPRQALETTINTLESIREGVR